MSSRPSDVDVVCALLWKLVRTHGWSTEVAVTTLARMAAVEDEQRASHLVRTRLAGMDPIGYHPGTDTVWIHGPPSSDLFNFLRDVCDYSALQLEATFGSYLDRLE